ncbi:MAG: class II glutamine amidotransferase [candidate division WOR-3 bacterium]
MCQLLGICANKEVDIQFSLKEFQYRGKKNKHGWGFAFFKNGKWEILKKPDSLEKEDIKEQKFTFKSGIIIGHVRLASCGDQNYGNTHPFKMDNWAFAHNGTVKIDNLHLKILKPKGKTDSEHIFCYLMEKIQNKTTEIEKILEKESDEIKRYGRLNFLISDGKKLYAYGDDSLFYTQRKAPFKLVKLKDVQYEMNLADIKSQDEKAIIIATERLTEKENWHRITGLKVFENGELISS